MLLNVFDMESEIRDKEDLRKKDYPLFTSPMIMDGKKRAQIGCKAPMKIEESFNFKNELKWKNIAWLLFFHMGSLYSLFTINPFENIATCVWSEYFS